ncbi:MAG: 3-dehydroquinate synthase [Arenicella sp.]
MTKKLSYNNSEIHFGDLQSVGFNDLLLKEYSNAKKIVFTDETVAGIWIETLITSHPELAKAEIIQIPEGEEFKTIEVCAQVWEALSEYEISRSDLIINFGGGVITDMGGFIASLYKRGLPFINIPTTLLSQVDASIGGKTGIDLGPHKNQIGVFSDAAHVFIDDQFLSTLDKDQLKSGWAEMLKHGLIADTNHWNEMQKFDPSSEANRMSFIQNSVQIKRDVVVQDHKESGIRKILNFGHTIGHGIEGFLLEQKTPTMHGYAVAWGMKAEAYLAFKKDLLSQKDYEEITSFISLNFPEFELKKENLKAILKLMYNDKKNKDGQIQFSLISEIGKGIFDQSATDVEILDALNSLLD